MYLKQEIALCAAWKSFSQLTGDIVLDKLNEE